jgi:hypothetical protein
MTVEKEMEPLGLEDLAGQLAQALLTGLACQLRLSPLLVQVDPAELNNVNLKYLEHSHRGTDSFLFYLFFVVVFKNLE